MNVLIACECSQTVCIEFKKLGANAYSCDLEKEYGDHPEWHIQCDVLKVLYGNCEFFTNDGKKHHVKKMGFGDRSPTMHISFKSSELSLQRKKIGCQIC